MSHQAHVLHEAPPGLPGVWQWVRPPRSTSLLLYVGRWQVGAVERTSIIRQGDPNKFSVVCRLPGIKNSLGQFPAEEEAVPVLLRAVEHWFRSLSASPKGH